MPTPSGVTIQAINSDGATQDVTEGVQALFDLVVQSMDFGSGFLSIEDVQPMVALAEFCGFDGSEPRRYVDDYRREERQHQCRLRRGGHRWERQPMNDRRQIWDVCPDCEARRFVDSV